MSLLGKYTAVLRQAWVERESLAPEKRLKSEIEFLPAALELMEAPPSPTARWLLWGTLTFISMALLWSIFGQIDIIAAAQGKITPAGYTKTLQPFENGVVRRILVRDGQHVKAGDLLIELDDSDVLTDLNKTESDLLSAREDKARAQLLLAALAGHREPGGLPLLDGMNAADRRHEQDLLRAEYAAFSTQITAMQAESRRLQATQATTHETLDKLTTVQPMIEQRASDYRALADKHYVPRHDYLDREQQRLETEKEIDVQRRRLTEAQSDITKQQDDMLATEADFRRKQQTAMSDAEQKISELEQDRLKLRQRLAWKQLRAPVDGVVQQLAVHTVGGVVTTAQSLLTVVPENPRLEIDAWLENKDIGFVNAGQDAEVKVEAFPFTRYGILHGKVVNVSLDAINDEKKGLLYETRVLLDQPWIGVEGKKVPLTPGMEVIAEIKTGKRRVIDYFLSPVLQYRSESARER
jgi:hemolysin D